MGDRLVNVIKVNGKPIAASYQHWDASGHETMNGIINCRLDDWENEHEKEELSTNEAVKILFESLREYNYSDKGIGFLVRHNDFLGDDKEYSSEEEKKFACLHPEYEYKNFNRNDGMVTINPETIEEWAEWAEWEDDYEM